MRYGNTPTHLKRVIKLGLVTGLLGYVAAALMGILVEGMPVGRLLPLVAIAVIPVAVMFLAGLPTVLFSIHIEGGWIEHRFLDRHVLSRAKAADFVRMKAPSFPFAAVLHFQDGRRIGIYGMHLGMLQQLKNGLLKARQ